MPRPDSQLSQQRWLPAVNTGNEEIPAFGCVAVLASGFASDYFPAFGRAREVLYEVGKPGADEIDPDDPYSPYSTEPGIMPEAIGVAFVGHQPIPPGKVGQITFDLPTVALVKPGDREKETLLPAREEFHLADPAGGARSTWFFKNLGLLEQDGDRIVIQRDS